MVKKLGFNSSHFLIVEISIKREYQQVSFNHLFDISII